MARDAIARFASTLVASIAASGCNVVIGLSDVPVPADANVEAGASEITDAGSPTDAMDATVANTSDAGEASTAEASPCGDTQGSPSNCGRCGHDCLGGACSMGACQPIALVASDSGASPYGLAQD